MNSYRIHNTTSGCILGVYQGKDEYSALMAMLKDAGCTEDDQPIDDLEIINVEYLEEELGS